MDEVLPGIFDWEAMHPKIRMPVHSHYVAASGTLIDPMLPPGGIDELREHGPPERVVLTIRHHDRESLEIARAFDVPVLCHAEGLHEFEQKELDVQPFSHGDEVAPGIFAHRVLEEWPDEVALHVVDPGVLVIADTVIREGEGDLAFVPDRFMDDPEHDKAAIRAGLRNLLALDFDHLLLAHGPPWIGGGKDALRRFAES